VQVGKRLEGKHVDARVAIAVEPLIESDVERADCCLGEQARLPLASESISAWITRNSSRRGESMADAMGAETSAYLHAVIGSSPDGSFGLDFESFRDRLMQDEPETLQRLVYDQLVPQPGGYMLDAPDSDGDTIRDLGISVAYVLAEHDRGLAPPGAELAARVGVTPVTVPGTHEAQLTHPGDIASAILGALN
jgi:hypothetical protein